MPDASWIMHDVLVAEGHICHLLCATYPPGRTGASSLCAANHTVRCISKGGDNSAARFFSGVKVKAEPEGDNTASGPVAMDEDTQAATEDGTKESQGVIDVRAAGIGSEGDASEDADGNTAPRQTPTKPRAAGQSE